MNRNCFALYAVGVLYFNTNLVVSPLNLEMDLIYILRHKNSTDFDKQNSSKLSGGY